MTFDRFSKVCQTPTDTYIGRVNKMDIFQEITSLRAKLNKTSFPLARLRIYLKIQVLEKKLRERIHTKTRAKFNEVRK